MGQRSQIYVRYNDTVIIANYYGWNYGERMISRARYGMEYLKNFLDEGWTHSFKDPYNIQKFSRVFDVNFDMKDVAISRNIVQEWKDYFADDHDVRDYVFERQDNNNGKLLVDIQAAVSRDDIDGGSLLSDYSIKYAFLDWECNIHNVMNAEQYMQWDSKGKYSERGKWSKPNESFSKEDIKICKANIEAIGQIAKPMTKEEVVAFLGTAKFMLPNGEIVFAEKPLMEKLENAVGRSSETEGKAHGVASEDKGFGTRKEGLGIVLSNNTAIR